MTQKEIKVKDRREVIIEEIESALLPLKEFEATSSLAVQDREVQDAVSFCATVLESKLSFWKNELKLRGKNNN